MTKIQDVQVRDLLFAKDCALIANAQAEMQLSVDLVAKACTNFGLTISTKLCTSQFMAHHILSPSSQLLENGQHCGQIHLSWQHPYSGYPYWGGGRREVGREGGEEKGR